MNEKGFSLVEFMVASTIGLFLLAGLSTFYQEGVFEGAGAAGGWR